MILSGRIEIETATEKVSVSLSFVFLPNGNLQYGSRFHFCRTGKYVQIASVDYKILFAIAQVSQGNLWKCFTNLNSMVDDIGALSQS